MKGNDIIGQMKLFRAFSTKALQSRNYISTLPRIPNRGPSNCSGVHRPLVTLDREALLNLVKGPLYTIAGHVRPSFPELSCQIKSDLPRNLQTMLTALAQTYANYRPEKGKYDYINKISKMSGINCSINFC